MRGEDLFDLASHELDPLPGCQAEYHTSQFCKYPPTGGRSRSNLGGAGDFGKQTRVAARFVPRNEKVTNGHRSGAPDPRIAAPVVPPIDRCPRVLHQVVNFLIEVRSYLPHLQLQHFHFVHVRSHVDGR
jgi:hypothetical protein